MHVAAAAAITLSMIYLAGGIRWVRHFSFPILFLFVAVPWIGPIEDPIVQGLMRIIAASAAEVLALFGIPAEVQGNLIGLPSGLVGVNEACSGVRSLQTSLTIGLLFGELKRLKVGGRLLLVASAVGIALFANFLRATFLVWIASSQTTAAVKQWHDTAGYAIVVLVFAGTMFLAARFRSPTQTNPSKRAALSVNRYRLSGRESAATQDAEPNNPQSAIRSPQSRFSLSLVTVGIVLLIWSGLVEVCAESWYRLHERNAVPRGSWAVRWPDKAQGYQEIEDRQRSSKSPPLRFWSRGFVAIRQQFARSRAALHVFHAMESGKRNDPARARASSRHLFAGRRLDAGRFGSDSQLRRRARSFDSISSVRICETK